MNQPFDGPNDSVGGPPPLQPYRPSAEVDAELRQRAVEKIEERNAFRMHLVTYLAIMALLTGIWAVTAGGGLFWPIFPMMGWGVGVAIHGASLLFDKEPSEDEIAREASRIRQRRGQPGRLED